MQLRPTVSSGINPPDINMSASITIGPTVAPKMDSVNPDIQVDCAGMKLEGSQTF